MGVVWIKYAEVATVSSTNVGPSSDNQHMSKHPETAAPPREDRRVRRSRRLLSEAILALLQEKPYDAITIQEIAERADLNRATFYLHYGSKDELLAAALEAQFDDLAASMEDTHPLEAEAEIRSIFEYVGRNHALYKVLLSERGTAYLVYRILDYLTAESTRELKAVLPAGFVPAVDLELVSRHFAGSLFALLSWWVLNDRPYPAEQIARDAHRLCVEGVATLVGPQAP
jgi:AcrR family transcriptional regulator